jgi:PPOX class probable F420-dependent enzyme
MDRAEALARLASAPSGHLATIRPDGGPHVVVVTHALADGRVVTAIDHKPKRSQRLQRLANIEANPVVSFLVDRYDDDWGALWWVRVDGVASIHSGGVAWESAVAALTDKYPQYQERPPRGPVIVVTPERVSWWESSG